MDKISELADELLIKILSFVPTKVAVSTSILSKRWEFLWMWLPKLEYDNTRYSLSECERLRCFLDRNLSLHRDPVIESLRLKFHGLLLKLESIKLWIVMAFSHIIHELKISFSQYPKEPNILPSSLYTCKSLVTLKLRSSILVDVPRTVCLPSLKTLHLRGVIYFSKDSLQRLLYICPILEDLLVDQYGGDKIGKFTVIIPSLQRLTLYIPYNLDALVMDTPCLKYFKLEEFSFESTQNCLIEKMPNLREAFVVARLSYIKSFIRSITSVKSLAICLQGMYGEGVVFNQLEHLRLCVCNEYSPSHLFQLLKDSPNLQVLDLLLIEEHYPEHYPDRLIPWNQPSTESVPECMLSTLQTFNSSEYFGRPQERYVAVYILKNARLLKTATFSSNDSYVPKLEMIKELSRSPRASTTCELIFD